MSTEHNGSILLIMNGAQFIKLVRRIGRKNSVEVRFESRHGKGSHGRLYYGTRFTTLKDRRKEIGPGLYKKRRREMQYLYPAVVEQDEAGYWLVTFPDVPEAGTDAETLEEALEAAPDALLAALGGYVEQRRDIPAPSPVASGQYGVALPVLASAKLALYQAMRDQGLNNTQLAGRLGVSETVVRRLLDLDHHSRIDHLERALAPLGKRLTAQVMDAA